MCNLYESDMLSIQKLLNFIGDEANGYRRCYKKYRKETGMTQEEMANRLGVTTPAVNKWENGNSKDSIDDEKVSRQKQFDRFCYYLGGIKQLLDKKAA